MKAKTHITDKGVLKCVASTPETCTARNSDGSKLTKDDHFDSKADAEVEYLRRIEAKNEKFSSLKKTKDKDPVKKFTELYDEEFAKLMSTHKEELISTYKDQNIENIGDKAVERTESRIAEIEKETLNDPDKIVYVMKMKKELLDLKYKRNESKYKKENEIFNKIAHLYYSSDTDDETRSYLNPLVDKKSKRISQLCSDMNRFDLERKALLENMKNMNPSIDRSYHSSIERISEVLNSSKHHVPTVHYTRNVGTLNPYTLEGTGAEYCNDGNSYTILASWNGSAPRVVKSNADYYDDPEKILGSPANQIKQGNTNGPDKVHRGLYVVGYISGNGKAFGYIPDKKMPFFVYK